MKKSALIILLSLALMLSFVSFGERAVAANNDELKQILIIATLSVFVISVFLLWRIASKFVERNFTNVPVKALLNWLALPFLVPLIHGGLFIVFYILVFELPEYVVRHIAGSFAFIGQPV